MFSHRFVFSLELSNELREFRRRPNIPTTTAATLAELKAERDQTKQELEKTKQQILKDKLYYDTQLSQHQQREESAQRTQELLEHDLSVLRSSHERLELTFRSTQQKLSYMNAHYDSIQKNGENEQLHKMLNEKNQIIQQLQQQLVQQQQQQQQNSKSDIEVSNAISDDDIKVELNPVISSSDVNTASSVHFSNFSTPQPSRIKSFHSSTSFSSFFTPVRSSENFLQNSHISTNNHFSPSNSSLTSLSSSTINSSFIISSSLSQSRKKLSEIEFRAKTEMVKKQTTKKQKHEK